MFCLDEYELIKESEYLHRISNHPVHIQDNKDDKLSPSAFIPFCEFGGKMEILGMMIDQLDFPVCNSFKAKIIKDQLCYEIDLNVYKEYISDDKFNKGLTLLIDENKNRYFSWNPTKKNMIGKGMNYSPTSKVKYINLSITCQINTKVHLFCKFSY